MAGYPSLPLFVREYLMDTTALTIEESGAYLHLLMHSWARRAIFPDDDKQLAAACKVSSVRWTRMRPVLAPYFRIENGVWINPRLSREWHYVEGISKKRSDAAAQRGKGRHQSNQVVNEANVKQTDIKSLAPTPTPTPTPTPNKKKSANADSSPPLAEALSVWNETARRYDLPEAQKLTASRTQRLRARLKDVGGLDGWRLALDLIGESDFLRGLAKADFRASLDFVLQESSFVKLIEGAYRTNKRASSPSMEALNRIRDEIHAQH